MVIVCRTNFKGRACPRHRMWVVSLQYFQEELSCFDPIDVRVPVALISEEARL